MEKKVLLIRKLGLIYRQYGDDESGSHRHSDDVKALDLIK